jgi:hypothetical protein
MMANSLQSTIREIEERLMAPQVRTDQSLVAPLLADDFVEFGSSGRVYDKEAVLSALAADRSIAPRIVDFSVKLLAPGTVLATYRTVRSDAGTEGHQQALRSSVWRELNGQWQLLFHQATPLPNI